MPEGFGPAARQEKLEEIVKANSPYHTEQWYPLLREHTFATEFVPLSFEEASQIIAHIRGSRIGRVDEGSQATVKAVVEKIDAAIQSVGGGQAFVRLSSRSPKDAVTMSKKMYTIYLNELKQLPPHSDGGVTDTIAFMRAAGKAMRVESGAEAMLLFNKSSRVLDDLRMACKICEETREPFSENIVVRKWENIAQEWELRAFVSGGVLTGCTQYYGSCFVPELAKRAKEIEVLVKSKFAQVHPILAPIVQDYVLDFAMDPSSDDMWIVEVNCPPPVAGTVLYNSANPRDMELLKHGPFELRVLTEPLEDPMKDHAMWKQLMRQQHGGGDSGQPVPASATIETRAGRRGSF